LTGEHPFIDDEGPNHSEALASASIRNDPTPIDEHLDSAPDGLWGVVEKTLAIKKEDRFNDMKGFVNAL